MAGELVPQKKNKCQASTEAGNVCGQPTMGPGIPFCANHYTGVTSGRKSKGYPDHLPDEIREKFEQQLSDPTPTDLTADIARVRAASILLDELLKNKVALAKQSGQSIKEEEFEMWASKITHMSESLRRLSESQARLFPGRVITLRRMQEILGSMMAIIRKTVKDEEVRKEIMMGFHQIAIALDQGASELIPGGSEKFDG